MEISNLRRTSEKKRIRMLNPSPEIPFLTTIALRHEKEKNRKKNGKKRGGREGSLLVFFSFRSEAGGLRRRKGGDPKKRERADVRNRFLP